MERMEMGEMEIGGKSMKIEIMEMGLASGREYKQQLLLYSNVEDIGIIIMDDSR